MPFIVCTYILYNFIVYVHNVHNTHDSYHQISNKRVYFCRYLVTFNRRWIICIHNSKHNQTLFYTKYVFKLIQESNMVNLSCLAKKNQKEQIILAPEQGKLMKIKYSVNILYLQLWHQCASYHVFTPTALATGQSDKSLLLA